MTRGISLHVGLNGVDPSKYHGWDGKLIACENDARDMDQLAKDAGFQDRTTLLTADATVGNVTTELRKAAQALTAGDVLFFTYSGHGGQIADLNGPEDEPDRLDETICLYDREYIDDEIYKEFEGFAEGVRILCLLDSCHSGSGVKVREILTPEALEEQFQTDDPNKVETTARIMPLDKQAEVYERDKQLYDEIQRKINAKDTRDLGATVLLISACQDNQLSADGLVNGLFTGTLLQVWNGGKFAGGYKAFHREILTKMPATQSPNLFVTGRTNTRFIRQRPFTI
ncbi:caspase family protein [Streptomyces cyanogenus]|uniref:Caspase domain protein n=1 Tax=Streptomyces cyanogenus TaxID=80860 RepID=A0ABX7U3P0_STRCY|nr:caspase family protein [Streptomyces cyanogenus]QTE02332.1 Caspase domain protein [Streptomyces cyanogenus]